MTEELIALARVIHIAKLKECAGPNFDKGGDYFRDAYSRQPWPEDRKEFTRMYQAGQSWMYVAIEQAKAVMAHMATQENIDA